MWATTVSSHIIIPGTCIYMIYTCAYLKKTENVPRKGARASSLGVDTIDIVTIILRMHVRTYFCVAPTLRKELRYCTMNELHDQRIADRARTQTDTHFPRDPNTPHTHTLASPAPQLRTTPTQKKRDSAIITTWAIYRKWVPILYYSRVSIAVRGAVLLQVRSR